MSRDRPSGGGAWLVLTLLLGGGAAVCAALGGLGFGAQVAGSADGPSGWIWRLEGWNTRPWTLWTAAWVHGSGLHLSANLVGTALVGALGRAAGADARAAWAWALAWPLGHLALLARPDLGVYGGLSGVLHAGVAVMVVGLTRSPAAGRRRIGWALALGLALKLGLEQPWLRPAARLVPGWDIAVVPWAHLSGALAGLVCAWACGVGRRPAAGRVDATDAVDAARLPDAADPGIAGRPSCGASGR